MHADHALNPELRERVFPNSRLKGAANCLVFANVDAASGSRNILKQLTGGLEVGPILMGMGNKAHIVSPLGDAAGALEHRRAGGHSGRELRMRGTDVTSYREVYESWKADPENFWMEAAEAIDWTKQAVRARSTTAIRPSIAGSRTARRTPAGTRSTGTSRRAMASRRP